MAVNSTSSFLALSWTLSALVFLLGLSGLWTLTWLLRGRCNGEVTKLVKQNVTGNFWSQWTLLLALTGLAVLALEPIASPGPIGGATRAVSLRFGLVFLAGESAMRCNHNLAQKQAGWKRRLPVWAATLLYIGGLVVLAVSAMQSGCDWGCMSWLQAAVCIAAGSSLVVTNVLVLRDVLREDNRFWLKCLVIVHYLVGPAAAAVAAWEALEYDSRGRNTVELQSPLSDTREMSYMVQVLAMLTYIATAQVLLFFSRGGQIIWSTLKPKKYVPVYADDATGNAPMLAPSWLF